MKKMLALIMCLSLLGIAGSAAAYAPVFTFEDLDPGPGVETDGVIPAGYHGFTWNADSYWITKYFESDTGYEYGTFGHVSLYTAYARPVSFSSSTPFDFNSAYITTAWVNSETVTVEGWLAGSKIHTSIITTHNDQAYWFSFNWTGVDMVRIIPANNNMGHIAIDNINGGAVPLPGTVALLGSGLLSLLGWRRLRQG